MAMGGTTPGTHFLGTTDNKALEFRVNNLRSLLIEPRPDGPNIIAGDLTNSASPGTDGVTISGGIFNSVGSDYATVGGGDTNDAGGPFSIVAGGQFNEAPGDHAVVGGGNSNEAIGIDATVAVGVNNTALGDVSTVAGGDLNFAGSAWDTVRVVKPTGRQGNFPQ